MFHNVCSASGLTTAVNEDITDIIRQQTKLKDSSKKLFPFTMRKLNFSCNQSTDVFFNTDDSFIALDLNKTFVKDPGTGEYMVATDMGDIIISRIVISESNTAWSVTFSY